MVAVIGGSVSGIIVVVNTILKKVLNILVMWIGHDTNSA